MEIFFILEIPTALILCVLILLFGAFGVVQKYMFIIAVFFAIYAVINELVVYYRLFTENYADGTIHEANNPVFAFIYWIIILGMNIFTSFRNVTWTYGAFLKYSQGMQEESVIAFILDLLVIFVIVAALYMLVLYITTFIRTFFFTKVFAPPGNVGIISGIFQIVWAGVVNIVSLGLMNAFLSRF